MLLIDIKDFRKMSLYKVPISESDIEAALDEALFDLTDTPMELKVRIKDWDSRGLAARLDGVEDGSTFRLNLYFPMWMPDGVVHRFTEPLRPPPSRARAVDPYGGSEGP